MSVHIINYKNGAKTMRPILSRDEYLSIRDSEANRRADKLHMVQMNYSCLPNEDGTLKGSKRISTTVGMDIDITAPPDLPQGEEMGWMLNKLENIKQIILEKKDALGLLMFEGSASKGYHIVFRRQNNLTQEGNLKWASELLGVEYDKGAKDITRVFFTPADKLIYLDDEIFKIEEAPSNSPQRERAPSNSPEGGGLVDCSSQVEEKVVQNVTNLAQPEAAPLGGRGAKAFDLCVTAAGLSSDQMDIWGKHNWHSNLMAVLSVGLPKLMSKEQLLAVVAEKLPNYSQTSDCKSLIDYFYDKYTADKGFMSVALRDINAKAQLAETVSDEQDAKDAEALTQGWELPPIPKKLPRLMELLVDNYDPRFRHMLLLAALPVLSAHASHFRATYINGKVIGPQQYVAVIGGSGQGKGTCTDLYNQMVRYTLEQNDTVEWEKVRLNSELRDQKNNAKDRPPKYHPKLRLFETTSKSSILELQTNLGKNGMLLGQFSEVDGLSSASKTAYSDISVLLRKGWDMDMHRQFYMSDATCNTHVQMSLSLLMAGTVKAMLERMFSDSNCEGGLMQRCIPIVVPKAKRTFRPPKQNFLSEDEVRERDSLIINLYQKDLSLGEGTYILETPMTNKAIENWYDELEERYNDGLLTEAEADLSHRCGEFILRAAIPLIALYGGESKEIVNFAKWVGVTAHYVMCHIFGQRVQNDITSADKLLAPKVDARKTAEPLLDKLPMVFTTQQFQLEREKGGQSSDSRMLLTRYCKSGKIERIGRGVYRKITKNDPLATT